MGVTDWVPGDVFTVRVYKAHVANPARLWVNSYEVQADPEVLPGPAADRLARLKAVAGAIASFETGFHLTSIRFDRYVVSTWLPDGQPHNPNSFDSTSFVNLTGQRSTIGTSPAPLEMCLLARRGVAFGRDGRSLYRGVLLEEDFNSPAGAPVLTGIAAGEIENLMDAPASLFAAIATEGFRMVMKGSSVNDVLREVNTLNPSGIVFKQLNNRYYDRA